MNALLLRPTEAAELLSVSRSRIYAMLASGELRGVRVGKRSVRVPAAALEQWVADHSSNADDNAAEPERG